MSAPFTQLAQIFTKIRRLTGCGNTTQLPDVQPSPNPTNIVSLTDYVNSFYLYDLPAQFRSLKLKDKYTFNTVQGQDTYPFDSEHYTTVEMPCYCAKREIKLFQDPWSFYGANFNWQQTENFATGDGTPGFLSGTVTNITQATNAVVTSANHGLVDGREVTLQNVGGMTEVNGETYTITVVNANSFQLNVNSTGFTAYTAGGNWASSAFNGITQAKPLIPSINNDPGALGSPILTYPMSRVQNILITANTTVNDESIGFVPTVGTINITDDGQGNLIEILQNTNATGVDQFTQTYYRNRVGLINYQTGEITFTAPFSQVIGAGNPIQIQYNPVTLAIPISILFHQNQFTLRPVPDKGYTVELIAYRQPTQALAQTTSFQGTAELNEWWELIAVGAAKKIYEDRIDPDGIAQMDKMLRERYAIAETRTYAQLGKQSASTLFRDQLSYNYGSGSFTFGGGGSV